MSEIVKQYVPVQPTQRAGALSLSTMTPQEAWMFCESLAQTPLLPDAYRRNPASVLWAMEYGRALGLDVVTTITTIHVIKGKPAQSADLMLSRAREAGHKVRIQQQPGQCTVSIWRRDDPEFENAVTWTYDDAVTANLCELRSQRPFARDKDNKPTSWEKYPRAMLRARAIAECVRVSCPEVLHGAIYTPEELGAWVDQDGNPVEAPAAPVQHLRAVPQEMPAEAPAEAPVPAEQEFTPDAGAQEHAGQAARYDRGRDHIKARWVTAAGDGSINAGVLAPDTGQPDVLGTYLTRLAGTLPETAPVDRDHGQGAVLETAQAPDGDAEAAEQELRIAASRVGLVNLDEEFERSYRIPIEQAPASQLREMASILTGPAAA